MASEEEEQDGLSSEEKAELRQLFDLVDSDGGGSISKEELQQLMETVGIRVCDDELDRMLLEIDENNDGEIQFEEFVAVMARKAGSQHSKQQVLDAFSLFAGSPGLISQGALFDAVTRFGNKLSEQEARQLIGQLTLDEDGLFHYADYVSRVMDK